MLKKKSLTSDFVPVETNRRDTGTSEPGAGTASVTQLDPSRQKAAMGKRGSAAASRVWAVSSAPTALSTTTASPSTDVKVNRRVNETS